MHLPRLASVLDKWQPRRNTQATSRLETLPIELLEIIFRFACIDGGRTGCNLALVSKYIRVTSRGSRFHSISMLGGISVQLHRFMLALHRARVQARAEGTPIPRVRHLCILLSPAVDPIKSNIKTTDLDRAVYQHQKTLCAHLSLEARIAQERKVSKIYHNAFVHLLAMVCADLETLCVLRPRYGSFPAPPLIPCPRGFPRLRELTFDQDLPSFAPPTDGTLMYPALMRLHMTLPSKVPDETFSWWAANAPKLAWLRIDTIRIFPEDADCYIVSDLARVLGESYPAFDLRTSSHHIHPSGPDANRHPWRGAPSSSWSSLKTLMLMINPIFPPEYTPSPPVAAAYAADASALNVELCVLGVPCTVFQPHYDRQDIPGPRWSLFNGEMEEGMRIDWLLRLRGGKGLFTADLWTRTP
ncbi:hypothetical protein VTO73DRAFT_11288 [Trametes versicolor]